jgi:hypothetical protein
VSDLEKWLPESLSQRMTPTDQVTLVNETGLPDDEVFDGVTDYFVENASMAWGRETRFQRYLSGGNMLARREYRSPDSVSDEIALARDLAERDDDVAAAMGQMIATAFSEGMENFHEDERTRSLYNAAAKEMNLDLVLKNMYREYLIASSLTTVTLFTRKRLEWTTPDGKTQTESVAVPQIGVLPSERVKVIGDDLFGTAQLAYDPDNENLRKWLVEYFDPKTTAARKAQLGRENRVAAAMFTGPVDPNVNDPDSYSKWGSQLYGLNPRVVHRTTMPKGSWSHPRPLLTRNFPLLEAKRLLNILDFALLQGGSNFIVVLKKGTDTWRASDKEVRNLRNVAAQASKTGVVIGDHRLNIEIITPDLTELLNPEKRRLIGRKLSGALRRLPETSVEDPGSEGMKTEAELLARVIAADRQDIKRHVERSAYEEMAKRNPSLFPKGAPKLWFPKIILQGTNYFTDYIVKLRDRGDIPRKWAVEAAGFDYDAAVRQRQRELDAGDDDVMIPGQVPFSSPDMGPQDNPEGRTPGGTDPARPRKRITRTPGETVKAWYEEEVGSIVRCGDITLSILEEYPDYTIGRISSIQRQALDEQATVVQGGVAAVPVNPEIEVRDERAVRLRDGLSMVVGERKSDGALFAKLLVFREPEFSLAEAEATVARWGFPLVDLQPDS